MTLLMNRDQTGVKEWRFYNDRRRYNAMRGRPKGLKFPNGYKNRPKSQENSPITADKPIVDELPTKAEALAQIRAEDTQEKREEVNKQ